jgi:outer membrane biosynthesis protein TonB
MKKFSFNTGLIFASWALLLMFGCHKKRPPVPPEQEPPTIISQIPTQSTEPPTTEQKPQPSTAEQEAANKPPEKPAHTPSKHPRHPAPVKRSAEPEKPAPTPTPTEEARIIPPAKVTIQAGGDDQGTGQASGVPGDNGSSVQGTTQQLLDAAENNLRNLKRQLSSNEQSMVDQVHDYIAQSKKATTDGDNVRAHILALKARLLSDELVKTQ